MVFHGFNKLTLLDYPEKVACTLFVGGCDLRCPFCHNSELVLHPGTARVIPESEVIDYLRLRAGALDGIVVTGGEPCLQKDLEDFMSRVREIGSLKIKLDTNGTHPDVLASVIDKGLCDYVAMDIKNSPPLYAQSVGLKQFDVTPICESVAVLLTGKVDYEFRTTAVRELHSELAFKSIGAFIKGAKKYYIQNFVDSGALISSGMHGFDAETLRSFAEIVRPYVGAVSVRGI